MLPNSNANARWCTTQRTLSSNKTNTVSGNQRNHYGMWTRTLVGPTRAYCYATKFKTCSVSISKHAAQATERHTHRIWHRSPLCWEAAQAPSTAKSRLASSLNYHTVEAMAGTGPQVSPIWVLTLRSLRRTQESTSNFTFGSFGNNWHYVRLHSIFDKYHLNE
jgi:hypothetical protein